MPKRIIELVREKEEQIKDDFEALEAFGQLAASALNQGRGSQEWKAFMTQFVDKDEAGNFNPGQLQRLLATDGTIGNEIFDRKRAYLLSNRMCGGLSPGATGTGVPAIPLDFQVDSIDEALDLDCLVNGQPNSEPAPEPTPNPEVSGE